MQVRREASRQRTSGNMAAYQAAVAVMPTEKAPGHGKVGRPRGQTTDDKKQSPKLEQNLRMQRDPSKGDLFLHNKRQGLHNGQNNNTKAARDVSRKSSRMIVDQ